MNHLPRGLWGAFVNTWERGYGALTNFYGRLLGWSLHHRPVIVVVAILSLVAAVAMIPLGLLPTEFMPTEDTSKVTIDIQMPAGTDLETTDKVSRQVEEIAMAYPETKSVLAQVGSQASSIFSQLGSSGASVTVNLVGKNERSRSSAAVADALRTDTGLPARCQHPGSCTRINGRRHGRRPGTDDRGARRSIR